MSDPKCICVTWEGHHTSKCPVGKRSPSTGPDESSRNIMEAWLNDNDHGDIERLQARIAQAIRSARDEALEEAATKAFEKVRCDDRTDRWQVANEVAAHIRSLTNGDSES